MAKNDNPQALRFLDSMAKHGEKDAGEKFSEEYPLAKSADFSKKFKWARLGVIALLGIVSGCLRTFSIRKFRWSW